MAYEDNVFINCPFDDEYRDLLRPLVFTVIYLGFTPRIASERLNSGETRFEKLCELIEASKYAIHDLSRMQTTRVGELFRLNMPFELGLDIGCSKFGPDEYADKECLILETKRYRYQAAISDLSNSDIASHGGKPERLVTAVRNWLAHRIGHGSVDGPGRIWGSFMDFMDHNDADLSRRGHTKRQIAALPVNELTERMETWAYSVGVRE